MTMKISVTVQNSIKLPSATRTRVVMRQAVNRAAAGARTEIIRAVRAEVPGLSARRVRADITVRPGGGEPVAWVRVDERPMSLRDVIRRVRQFKGSASKPGGVKGSLGPGRSLEIPKAFIGPGGHLYMRRGKARLPIRRLSAPSVRDIAVSVWDETRPRVEERLQTQISRGLERLRRR